MGWVGIDNSVTEASRPGPNCTTERSECCPKGEDQDDPNEAEVRKVIGENTETIESWAGFRPLPTVTKTEFQVRPLPLQFWCVRPRHALDHCENKNSF